MYENTLGYYTTVPLAKSRFFAGFFEVFSQKIYKIFQRIIFFTLQVFISDFAGIMQICTEKGEKKT